MNQLQRKVLLVIVLIILVPMLITGTLSARWITSRLDASIERGIRESVRLDETALADLHKNARLFANILDEVVAKGELQIESGRSPIPARLQPLAGELGITLIQVYGYDGELIYSSLPVTLSTSWARGQDTAVVKINQNRRNRLAAITIVRIPRDQPRHYRLVLGTLFDQAFLNRLNHMSPSVGNQGH